MAVNYAVGGGNALYLYTMNNGTTPTVGTTPVLSLVGAIVQTALTYDGTTGASSIDLGHVSKTKEFDEFCRAYKNTASSGEVNTLTLEDGVDLGGTANTNNPLLVVSKGVDNGTGEKYAFVGVMSLNSSSGGYTQAGLTITQPTFQLDGIPLGGELVLSSAYFSGVLTTPAPVTLDPVLDKYGRTVWG